MNYEFLFNKLPEIQNQVYSVYTLWSKPNQYSPVTKWASAIIKQQSQDLSKLRVSYIYLTLHVNSDRAHKSYTNVCCKFWKKKRFVEK